MTLVVSLPSVEDYEVPLPRLDLGPSHRKLERAAEHLASLLAVVDTVRATEPFVLTIGDTNELGWSSVYLTSAAESASRLATIAADFVQNMRAALDYVITAAVDVTDGLDLRASHQFPIYTSASKFSKEVATEDGRPRANGSLHGLHSEFAMAVRAMQPFNFERTTALETVNVLSNTDKHRQLLSELALPAGTAALAAESDGKILEVATVVNQFAIPAENIEIARIRVAMPTPKFLRVVLETDGEVAIAAPPFAGRSGVILPVRDMEGMLSEIRAAIEGFAVA